MNFHTKLKSGGIYYEKCKSIFCISLCTALFLLASCKSATPLQLDGIVDILLTLSNYELLDYKILEEAQKEYPTANDVVNVTVDFEGTRFLFFQKGTYTTTALAVRYK